MKLSTRQLTALLPVAMALPIVSHIIRRGGGPTLGLSNDFWAGVPVGLSIALLVVMIAGLVKAKRAR